MGHERKADSPRRLHSSFEEFDIIGALDFVSQSHLDANHNRPVILHGLGGQFRIHRLQDVDRAAYANGAERADVHERLDSGNRSVDHVLPQVCDSWVARRTSIHNRGDAFREAKMVRIYAIGHSVIAMLMDVDHSWSNNLAFGGDDAKGAALRNLGRDLQDFAVQHGNVHWRVQLPAGIDQRPAFDQQITFFGRALRGLWLEGSRNCGAAKFCGAQ